MAKNIKIKGLDKLIKDLTKLGDEGIKALAKTTEANAREIEADAKVLAPADLGKLRQGIKAYAVNKLRWKIQANFTGLAPYSAYVEFGTGALFDAPDELQAVAIKFKGKGGGSFEEGLEAIKEWCKRKGIDEDAAYPIFVSILKNGQMPRPYLYPAFVKGRMRYLNDLKQELKDLTKNI